MRVKNLVVKDIFFQWKYGFYFIYGLLSIVYICILNSMSGDWKSKISTVLVYSDPAAIGLFLMGAIILLEKSQKVLNAIAVSPVRVFEYILSKVLSLVFISTIVAGIIGIATGMSNIGLVLVGTGLTSSIFTLIGITAATQINSLNQFILISLLIEIICFIPPIVNILSIKYAILKFFPLDAATRIIAGTSDKIYIDIVVLFLVIMILFLMCIYFTKKMFRRVGGVKE